MAHGCARLAASMPCRGELAGTAGISVTTLARLERYPRTRCRGRTLARLALALGEDPASTTLRPAS